MIAEPERTNELTKEDLQEILKEGKSSVVFIKKDGTTRLMKCTLDPLLLPKVDGSVEKKTKKVNDEVLSVWSIDDEGWRSLRTDSVINIEKLR